MDTWTKEIEIDGKVFVAQFRKRPFREGIEVVVDVNGESVRIAELGLGESALVERITAEIRRMMKVES